MASRVHHAVGVDAMSNRSGWFRNTARVADGVADIGDHHGQIRPHLTTVMPAATLFRRGHRCRQAAGQTDCVTEICEEAGTDMTHHVRAVRPHHEPCVPTSSLHLESALLVGIAVPSQASVSLTRRALSQTRPSHAPVTTETAGLGRSGEVGLGEDVGDGVLAEDVKQDGGVLGIDDLDRSG